MLQFNSALLAFTAEFCGRFTPWESVHIQPHSCGVLLSATDGGKALALAFDPTGTADEAIDIVPDKDLLKACAGIKSADRDILIEGASAVVTTYRKTPPHDTRRFGVTYSSQAAPPLGPFIAHCVQRWGATPQSTATAGRYSMDYLLPALRAVGHLRESVVLSAFDGGPLRLQGEGLDICVLIMPMTAEAIPDLPGWLRSIDSTDFNQAAGA